MEDQTPPETVTTDDTVLIDNIQYKVSDLTENQRAMVSLYKEWTEEEVALNKRVLQLQGAKRDMARQVVLNVRNAIEAKAAEAAEKAATESEEIKIEAPDQTETSVDLSVKTDGNGAANE